MVQLVSSPTFFTIPNNNFNNKANRPPSAGNRNIGVGMVGPGASVNSMGARGNAVQPIAVSDKHSAPDHLNSGGQRAGFNINAHPSKLQS